MLCGDILAYPIGFDAPAFEGLKLALLQSRNPRATADIASETPFHVVVVTQLQKYALSSDATTGQIPQITSILEEILTKASPTKLPQEFKYRGTIPARNSLGIVVFNEYFFSGPSPMDSRQEAAIGRQISQTIPNYVFAITSLTQSQTGTFQDSNSVSIQPAGKASLQPINLIGLSKTPKYPDLLSHVIGGKASLAPLVSTGAQAHYGSSQIKPLSGQAITNRTIFWYNGEPVAQYCKNTYHQECDDEIRKGASYYIGYQTIMEKQNNQVAKAIRNNFDVQICSDHQFGLGIRTGCRLNFQILTSFTIQSIPLMYWCDATTETNARLTPIQHYQREYEKIIQKNPGKRAIVEAMINGAYFIHADGQILVRFPFPLNMYQREAASTTQFQPYHQPSPVTLFAQFMINKDPFKIEIYQISPQPVPQAVPPVTPPPNETHTHNATKHFTWCDVS
jgi:hypothetical protein